MQRTEKDIAMHTAICTFQDRDTAERARERLLRAGFQRDDLHVEHRGDTAAGEDPRGWIGTDHEIAASRDMVDKVAGFFVRLFGRGHPEGHDSTYADAVERGRFVLVVDAQDDAEAQRARTLLHELSAEDVNVVHRPQHRPLREILGLPKGADERGFAGSYHDRASAFDDPAPEHAAGDSSGVLQSTLVPSGRETFASPGAQADRERATASGVPVDSAVAPSAGRDWSPSPGADADRDRATAEREDERDRVGLRYADKDKPGRG